jgi:hypothetical protein
MVALKQQEHHPGNRLVVEVINRGAAGRVGAPGPDEYRVGTVAVLRSCVSLLGGSVSTPTPQSHDEKAEWRSSFDVPVPSSIIDGKPVTWIQEPAARS